MCCLYLFITLEAAIGHDKKQLLLRGVIRKILRGSVSITITPRSLAPQSQ